MPEHLRALVYILVLATVVFAFARASATASAIAPSDFKRRRNLWFAITLIAFLSGNFWTYIPLSAVILLIALPAEQNRFVGLFFFLGLFATVCRGVYGATTRTRDEIDERRLLGRALLATLIGILVSILTVSSISVIPTVYWCIAGVAVAYARLASVEVRPAVSALRETKAGSPGKFERPTGASAGR